VNKADLIDEVAGRAQQRHNVTARIVNELIGAVGRALSEGREIQLRRFGAFRIRRRGSREMCNPRTGERYRVPAKIVPMFRASRAFAELIETPAGPTAQRQAESPAEGN